MPKEVETKVKKDKTSTKKNASKTTAKTSDKTLKKDSKKIEKSKNIENSKNIEKPKNIKKSKDIAETKEIEKSKDVRKSKKTDERIKQIIAEQLENVNKIEEIKDIPVKKKETKKNNQIDEKKLAEQIETAKKMPKQEKKEIYKNVLGNILLGTCVILYFIVLLLAFANIESAEYIKDLKVFSIATLAATIILFEYAYNKDDGKIAVKGIELLCVAIITLILLYIYILHQEKYLIITCICAGIATVYYLVKSIAIYVRDKSKWKKTISDVKKIVEDN